MIVNKEVVLRAVEGFALTWRGLSMALETQGHVLFWWAIKAVDFDSFLDVSLANRAGNRSEQLVKISQAFKKGFILCGDWILGLLLQEIVNEFFLLGGLDTAG